MIHCSTYQSLFFVFLKKGSHCATILSNQRMSMLETNMPVHKSKELISHPFDNGSKNPFGGSSKFGFSSRLYISSSSQSLLCWQARMCRTVPLGSCQIESKSGGKPSVAFFYFALTTMRKCCLILPSLLLRMRALQLCSSVLFSARDKFWRSSASFLLIRLVLCWFLRFKHFSALHQVYNVTSRFLAHDVTYFIDFF